MLVSDVSIHNPHKQTSKQKVSFGAAPQGVATKMMKTLEFDGFNFSTLGLCAICYGSVLGFRYAKSRDNVEKREILVRDLSTITAIIFARRAVQNVVSRICTKKTGLALHTKPSKHDTALQKVFNYLRPDNGIRVLSSAQIIEKYSNVHQYKNGIVDFANFISKQGGDVKKVLTTDKKLGESLQAAHASWSGARKTSLDKADSKEIIEMLSDLNKKEQKDPNIKKMEEFFKDKNNSLIKKAKSINSTFDFLTTFGFIPVVLGFILPYFNEQVTKKSYKTNKN